jgi:hypothetical protein
MDNRNQPLTMSINSPQKPRKMHMENHTFSRQNLHVLAILMMPLFGGLALPIIASAESAPAPAMQASSVPLRSYTTKAGDKLDRIIQITMPDSPLKIEVLRKAFIELNPLAFPAGSANQMRKGMVLTLPDAPKILSSLAAPSPKDLADHKKMSGPASGDYEERRRWVRYP